MVASSLVRFTLDWVVWIRAAARAIVLCYWKDNSLSQCLSLPLCINRFCKAANNSQSLDICLAKLRFSLAKN